MRGHSKLYFYLNENFKIFDKEIFVRKYREIRGHELFEIRQSKRLVRK